LVERELERAVDEPAEAEAPDGGIDLRDVEMDQ